MKRITRENFFEYKEKIEIGKCHFIPMLPFVKLDDHDFDIYMTYSEKGIYLIDYLDDGLYCLYHLYQLTSGDETLRATLLLPSHWENRFEIIEKSISNLKHWFRVEEISTKLIIQSLEYGEIEYYPTLSHYIIPTLIRNGFLPKYRMYMRRVPQPLQTKMKTPEGYKIINYTDDLLPDLLQFYFKNKEIKEFHYFSNLTETQFKEKFMNNFTRTYTKIMKDPKGGIIAAIIPGNDRGEIWIDNFTVHPKVHGISEFLLNQMLNDIATTDDVYVYVNRDCKGEVDACEKHNFQPFEFWTDLILEK
ncbi:hypothetical protein AWH56_012880 [Anaerobacillus isosaccharinicus]|uniref:Uncharacterized protein n=1 Tax=Anaerobacillus isosaccharinicus TaxID=1532552 RepID=A0A1S2M5E8_9BACI|nr:hypothetical protein [Anaerobacillus isosaccharinicus]MBA5588211.1 hypothetical protein [Anaerobacillus isosaccharinicus]QOY38341.1 hypothetical protein AWH56_012880 [Anaerobacillus isosaccharinicus]